MWGGGRGEGGGGRGEGGGSGEGEGEEGGRGWGRGGGSGVAMWERCVSGARWQGSREAPHEQYCYVGRYLVYAGLDCGQKCISLA